MAIFEKETPKKVLLDDTERLTAIIENWRTVDGHTEFIIRIQRGSSEENTWRIYKRYNDFHKLHSRLQLSGISLQLPPKKLIGNMDPNFINERQRGLQEYLNAVLMNPILVSSLPARSFVDPANYCQPFGELALQHVSLALRGEVGWEVVSSLADIGWRLRKHFYQVRCKSLPKDDLIAAWIDYGPDKYLEEKDMHALFKSLNQIKHPFIYSIELCLCTDIGGLVVRQNHKNGSLRDTLYKSRPTEPFLKKYGNPKGHKPLGINQIALYGRQILEALKFLHEKGLPYGHLHTGNIIIEEDRVRLLDIENGILGVPSFYRPYFIQHKKISTIQAVDVYCFGHTLYEMTFGSPLHESTAGNFHNCPAPLKSILESILSSESCKAGLPSVETLLSNSFFSSVVLTLQPGEKTYLKISTSTKEHLKSAVSQMEDRLREEQRNVRSQKRLVKVQEMMSSEEEKKKQRHKLKQEQKLAKEKQKQERETNHSKITVSTQEGRLNESSSRPGSINNSRTTSIETAAPPSMSGINATSPPPPPPPPMEAPPVLNGTRIMPPANVNTDRSVLLGAICNFDKSSLKSCPKPK